MSDQPTFLTATAMKKLQDELEQLKQWVPTENRLSEAIQLFDQLVTDTHYEDFLTIPAYQLI